MMTNSSCQGHPVLTDVTNKPGKRTFSSVSGDLVNYGGGKEGNPNPAKVLRAGVDSLLTGKNKSIENFTRKYKQTCGSVDDRDESYKNVDVTSFSSSQCGSVGSSVFPSSCGTQSIEIEGCTGLKGDQSSTLSAAVSSLKSCSCSFCLKAAYIWSDLHYQDIKGRISAVNKSQKEAITLVQRNVGNKESQSSGLGSSSKASNLESDLRNQWNLLFLRTEDMFGREITQLKDNFRELKDLREKCKKNLEFINAKPSEE